MIQIRIKIPRFNLAKAEAETQLAMFEIMKEVAAKWVRRASFIPRVSGQARGTFLGLADAAQTSLTKALPSTAKIQPPIPTRGQSSATGRAAQRYTLTPLSASLVVDLQYINRWQGRWGNPLELAKAFIIFDFEDALRSNESAFLPVEHLEFTEILSG